MDSGVLVVIIASLFPFVYSGYIRLVPFLATTSSACIRTRRRNSFFHEGNIGKGHLIMHKGKQPFGSARCSVLPATNLQATT